MQLVAYGAQDIYLTGNPEITYFKTVYRRHTNFAMESVSQLFNESADFGSNVTAMISRQGDLLSGLYLQTTLPDLVATGDKNVVQRWTDHIGHYLINSVSVEIGGYIVDTHYGDWLEIWSQLTVPAGQKEGYLEMIGQDPRNPLGMNTGLQRDLAFGDTIPGRTIYVPLQFWFCRNVGLALPLIALQYHEVKVHITLSSFTDMTVNKKKIDTTAGTDLATGALIDTTLWADFIYLDTDERRRFAQISHEYLIEQVQFNGDYNVDRTVTSATVELGFSHPVKELVWVSRFTNATANNANQWCNYTNSPATLQSLSVTGYIASAMLDLGEVYQDQPVQDVIAPSNIRSLTNPTHVKPPDSLNGVATAKLKLNGHTRFAKQNGTYFNWIQCRAHHTNIPTSPGINVYSFALKPEEHQPSGSCNFSRVKQAKLILTFTAGVGIANASSVADDPKPINFLTSARVVKIYAVNYNILRVMSGMGGLAYTS